MTVVVVRLGGASGGPGVLPGPPSRLTEAGRPCAGHARRGALAGVKAPAAWHDGCLTPRARLRLGVLDAVEPPAGSAARSCRGAARATLPASLPKRSSEGRPSERSFPGRATRGSPEGRRPSRRQGGCVRTRRQARRSGGVGRSRTSLRVEAPAAPRGARPAGGGGPDRRSG